MNISSLFAMILDSIGSVFAFLYYRCLDFYHFLSRSDRLTFTHSQISVQIVASTSNNIGEGAFSTVYKVKDVYNPSQNYAVKQMIIQSHEYNDIAKIEIEAFRRFHHKYLIKLVDSLETQHNRHKTIFLLLPYYGKGSLRHYLNAVMDKKSSHPSFTYVLTSFRNICEGLNVLHNYQPSYVHQDIKPEVSQFPFCNCLPSYLVSLLL
jgi:hypothetical protein